MTCELAIAALQLDLAERLRGDAMLSVVPVLFDQPPQGDIEDMSDEMIYRQIGPLRENAAGKCGICIVIQNIIAFDDYPNTQGGPLTLQLSFLVIEHLAANRGVNCIGLQASAVARRIHRIIKPYTPTGLGTCMVADQPCIKPVPLDPGLLAFEVGFKCGEAADDGGDNILQRPVLTYNGGTNRVTITSPDGKPIYYTLDNSYPNPLTASSYSVPFNPGSALYVRAICNYAGYIASSAGVLELIP